MTDFGLLLLRLGSAGFMITHGFGKLMNFSQYSSGFPDPLGVGSQLSLSLAIFGEFICPILIIMGVLTRLSAFASFFTMFVAGIIHHAGDPFEKRELALVYAVMYLVLVFTGPGQFALWKPKKLLFT